MPRPRALLTASAFALMVAGPLPLGISPLGISAARPADAPVLVFSRREGLNLNQFIQDGPVAAHLLLRAGAHARLLVAFPAGNSAVGLWLDTAAAATWTLATPPEPVTLPDAKGRPLRGIRFDAVLHADDARLRDAVLSSARVLRDYEVTRAVPILVRAPLTRRGDTLEWARDRLDGRPGYRLTVMVTHGQMTAHGWRAGPDGTIGLRVTALTGETPLTPLTMDDLLTPAAAADTAARDSLGFLAYREKLLAGSWHFNTYFGRDTLMSVMLLMPALQRDAVEAGLRAVLARLSPEGAVAHEEDIGEFAILDHLRDDGSRSDAPVYDYKMIDSDFLLAPVAKAWLLDDARGHAAAAAFLAAPDGRQEGGGEREPAGAALVRNLRRVVAQAAPFASHPGVATLLHLKPGVPVGDWRDSSDGLGGGRIPYDVNAVLVPAALEAAQALLDSGLLDPWLDAGARAGLARAGALAKVWREQAPPLFTVDVDAARARRDVAAYAAAVGVPSGPALASLPADTLRFHALSLDAEGRPVAVLNSDEGFTLLLGHPTPKALEAIAQTVLRPFPAGLSVPGVGMVVANPAFAPAGLREMFARTAYHGTVVWSWQQALMAAGLKRQLARSDLPAATRDALERAHHTLWAGIEAAKAFQNSELWSWNFQDGHYTVVPFGAGQGDATESDAAQLWSTVYLAVSPRANGNP